uniref:DUF2637 domain-containing protein n=1 Tax=Streptomyces albiflavescens TaxID=1623582 RepID=UPI001E3C7A1F|nr:DUF2637 domain-containing protein [Streptomyces albiflavescens]
MSTGSGEIPRPARGNRILLTRTHRILIGVVVAGAVVIAGIGFAGSYAAVRELAVKKGFGNFAYVFPIGIDAGICVLLALDLLLTWIRIPFPLLRQTAWLLTAATIAFNGAAAWPDPLGVGMHAVIPILFVVAVEAARHAIGRIADITADKHMEGVRLTRWLLSPLPTFLLWRRMKLWELRSYEQVIKLEQERLVYQARLRSRFGRAWRRKAPVESLMPLRLARYGVPLSETALSGLAAAGIKEAAAPTREPQVPVGQRPKAEELGSTAERPELPSALAGQPAPGELTGSTFSHPQSHHQTDQNGLFAQAYEIWIAQFQVAPTPQQFGLFLRDQYAVTTAAGGPLSDEQLLPILASLQQHYASTQSDAPAESAEEGSDDTDWDAFFYSAWVDFAQAYGHYPDADALARYVFERDGVTTAAGQPLVGEDIQSLVTGFWQREFGETDTQAETNEPTAAPNGQSTADTSIPRQPSPQGHSTATTTVAASETKRGPEVRASADQHEQDPSPEPAGEGSGLTTVDRYFLAWTAYQDQHGQEPKDKELSTYLADHGVLGRGGQAVSPSTLRRYLPGFRIYTVWADLRARTEQPTAQDVAGECALRGISVRRAPVTAAMIENDIEEFERRWQAIAQHARLSEAPN